jgi:hypothetical protein
MHEMQTIGVTTHAIKRLKERFFFFFPVSCFYTPEDTKSLIRGQIRTARKLLAWKMVPFYVNMFGSRYGPNMEVYYKKPVYYIVKETPERISVLTTVKKFLPHNEKT